MELQELKKTDYETEANGNKLENLVFRNKTKKSNFLIETHVEREIGRMFIFKAKDSILRNCFGSASPYDRPFLKRYSVDIDVLEQLYGKYQQYGNGIQFDFIFINNDRYCKCTGNPESTTAAGEFLYFLATPIDHNNNPLKEHYVIFNLANRFEIDKDVIDNVEFEELTGKYFSQRIFDDMSAYSKPILPTKYIVYDWADIQNIFNKRNILGKLYKELDFFIGEVIEFEIISDYFKEYSYYNFDETKYKAAYLAHEKRLTLLGKYLPDDRSGKEGYFDMGDLRP